MELKTLLENFDAICELPGGINRVRSRIVDLVIEKNLSRLSIKKYAKSKMFSEETTDNFDSLSFNDGLFISIAELVEIGLIVDIQDGNHSERHPKIADFTDKGIPFITAAQINNFNIDYRNASKLSGIALERINQGFAIEGDIIYTHKGSVGRVAISNQNCILSPQTTYYRTCQNKLFNKYLMWYFYSSHFTKQVNLVKEQATRDYISINQQHKLFCTIPFIEKQKQIVEKIEAATKKCNRLQTAKENRDTLHKKLSNKAT